MLIITNRATCTSDVQNVTSIQNNLHNDTQALGLNMVPPQIITKLHNHDITIYLKNLDQRLLCVILYLIYPICLIWVTPWHYENLTIEPHYPNYQKQNLTLHAVGKMARWQDLILESSQFSMEFPISCTILLIAQQIYVHHSTRNFLVNYYSKLSFLNKIVAKIEIDG